MSDTKKTLDSASTGGGIGDISAQPIDQTASPAERVGADDDSGEGTGLVDSQGLMRDNEATPSGEDPDDTADETLGVTP